MNPSRAPRQPGKQHIVGIEMDDVRINRVVYGHAPRGPVAGTALMDDPGARITGGICVGDRRGAIRGAVIDDDEFPGLKRLREPARTSELGRAGVGCSEGNPSCRPHNRCTLRIAIEDPAVELETRAWRVPRHPGRRGLKASRDPGRVTSSPRKVRGSSRIDGTPRDASVWTPSAPRRRGRRHGIESEDDRSDDRSSPNP